METLPPCRANANVVNSLGSPGFAGPDLPPVPPSFHAAPKPRHTKRSTTGNRVLLFGRLRELALYRAEVLRNHGFKVVIPRTKEEAKEAILRCDFDVAVFSYTLSSQIVEEVSDLLREHCPGCPLIAISDAARTDRRIHPDETVLADDGPPALIAAIHRVIQRN